jgi:hypothetical protein
MEVEVVEFEAQLVEFVLLLQVKLELVDYRQVKKFDEEVLTEMK